jgi:hypothetical protein
MGTSRPNSVGGEPAAAAFTRLEYSAQPRTVQKLERCESGMVASKFVATLGLISLLHLLRVRDQLTADGKDWRGGFEKGANQWV